MIAAIAGDIIGSVYERRAQETADFPLLDPRSRCTDDTVMTVAVVERLLHGHPHADTLRSHGRRWPGAGDGGMLRSDRSGRYRRRIRGAPKDPGHDACAQEGSAQARRRGGSVNGRERGSGRAGGTSRGRCRP